MVPTSGYNVGLAASSYQRCFDVEWKSLIIAFQKQEFRFQSALPYRAGLSLQSRKEVRQCVEGLRTEM